MLQADAQIIRTITRTTPQSVTHTIVKKDKDDKRQRRASKRYYARISKDSKCAVAKKKLKLVLTDCPACKNNPFLGLDCFVDHHK